MANSVYVLRTFNVIVKEENENISYERCSLEEAYHWYQYHKNDTGLKMIIIASEDTGEVIVVLDIKKEKGRPVGKSEYNNIGNFSLEFYDF